MAKIQLDLYEKENTDFLTDDNFDNIWLTVCEAFEELLEGVMIDADVMTILKMKSGYFSDLPMIYHRTLHKLDNPEYREVLLNCGISVYNPSTKETKYIEYDPYKPDEFRVYHEEAITLING